MDCTTRGNGIKGCGFPVCGNTTIRIQVEQKVYQSTVTALYSQPLHIKESKCSKQLE